MSHEEYALLSIRPRREHLEQMARACRDAYSAGRLNDGANMIADAYEAAARVLREHEAALGKLGGSR